MYPGMSCYTHLIRNRARDASKTSTALSLHAERFLAATDPARRALLLAVYATKLIQDAHSTALIAGSTLAANDLA